MNIHQKEIVTKVYNIRRNRKSILGLVSNELLAMARVKDLVKRFGKVISRINNTMIVNKLNSSPFFPILDGKVLYINMSITFS